MGSCFSYRQIESFDLNDQIRYFSDEIDKLEGEKNALIGKNQNMYIRLTKDKC